MENLKILFQMFVIGIGTFVAMVAVPVAVVAVTENEDAAIISFVAVILGGVYVYIRAAMRIS